MDRQPELILCECSHHRGREIPWQICAVTPCPMGCLEAGRLTARGPRRSAETPWTSSPALAYSRRWCRHPSAGKSAGWSRGPSPCRHTDAWSRRWIGI